MRGIIGFVVFNAAVLGSGVWQAWRVWRGSPADRLRSARLKSLSYLLFAISLVVLSLVVVADPAWIGRAPALVLLPGFAAAVTMLLGYAAHRREQADARASELGLGLAVPPRRLSPTALAIIYGAGALTALPILLACIMWLATVTFSDRLDVSAYGPVGPSGLAAVFVAYGLAAMLHVGRQRLRIRAEAASARSANLS